MRGAGVKTREPNPPDVVARLCEKNVRLAHRLANRKWRQLSPAQGARCGGKEELHSAALFGLVDACRRFDTARTYQGPDGSPRPYKFSTYGWRVIRQHLERHCEHCLRGPAPSSLDDVDPLALAAPGPEYSPAELRECVSLLGAGRESWAVRLVVMGGAGPAEVGRLMGVTGSRVRQLRDGGLARLREAYGLAPRHARARVPDVASFTTSEVARLVGVHKVTVQKWCRSGRLRAERINRRAGHGDFRVHRADLEAFLTPKPE